MAVQALKQKMNGSTTSDQPSKPHPLARLTSQEIDVARQVVNKAHAGHLFLFRDIFSEEPAKADLVPFLEAEHSGLLTEETPRPRRLARIQYDTISKDGSHAYTESVVDVNAHEEVLHLIVDKEFQPPLTMLAESILLMIFLTAAPGQNLRSFKTRASPPLCGKKPFHSLNCPKALVSRFT
jgi:Cu2+-containing amine oxidase